MERDTTIRDADLELLLTETDRDEPFLVAPRPEKPEQHRGQLSRVRRRSNKNVVASQRDEPARSQIAPKLGQNRSRRRNASEDLSVNDSGRHRLRAPVNVSSVAEARHLDFENR